MREIGFDIAPGEIVGFLGPNGAGKTMFGNAGSWPITIYPGWLRTTLTFFVPVAFAVTIPAESLPGGWRPAQRRAR